MSDYISEDLWFLILKGLPVKSLLRFRSVCKSWKQIIDSRSFILDNLADQYPVLLVQNTRPKKPELQYFVLDPEDLASLGVFSSPDEVQTEVNHPVNNEDEDTDDYRLIAVSTVHGVICLYDNENRLFLWNPSIRRVLRLPVPEVRSDAANLNYDPDLYYYKCCGFWMDPFNNDFKIVIFFFPDRKYSMFNSSNQAWIEMDIEAPRLSEGSWEMTNDSPMVLVEGVGYWMLNDDSGEGVVFHFDFLQDKSGTIEFPEVAEGEEAYSDCVTRWQDYVAIIHWQYNHPADCLLSVLDNGSWCKMLNWKVYEPLEFPLYVNDAFDYVLVHRNDGLLVPYDPEVDYEFLESKPYSHGWHRVACDFMESLVFPNLDCQ